MPLPREEGASRDWELRGVPRNCEDWEGGVPTQWEGVPRGEGVPKKGFERKGFVPRVWEGGVPTQGVPRAGPNGIKNFNPGIFRDGILPNPGIPGFFGTGFSNIFYPGI